MHNIHKELDVLKHGMRELPREAAYHEHVVKELRQLAQKADRGDNTVLSKAQKLAYQSAHKHSF